MNMSTLPWYLSPYGSRSTYDDDKTCGILKVIRWAGNDGSSTHIPMQLICSCTLSYGTWDMHRNHFANKMGWWSSGRPATHRIKKDTMRQGQRMERSSALSITLDLCIVTLGRNLNLFFIRCQSKFIYSFGSLVTQCVVRVSAISDQSVQFRDWVRVLPTTCMSARSCAVCKSCNSRHPIFPAWDRCIRLICPLILHLTRIDKQPGLVWPCDLYFGLLFWIPVVWYMFQFTVL